MVQAEWDKVLVLKENGRTVGVVIHDTAEHTKSFHKTEEMDMDTLLEVLNKKD